MADLQKIADSVIGGKAADVKSLVTSAISEGVPVEDILKKGLIAGMDVVGTKFRANEFYVPEVLIAARAMHAGMDILQPLLTKAGIKPLGKVAVGTVKGDLHDIGKNLVVMMLKGGGFEVMDLGIDVPEEKFVAAVKEGAQVIGLSALLTTTMTGMKSIIEALKVAGVRNNVKVMIGGAPITQAYADEIGADAYGEDAATATIKAKELIGVA
ncbi:MAG: corrinoid protein [Candidatus Omnitrophota bacterium]|nr:corrinoid protein [Candidatus Omnitrophota bacterium]